jgi:hypothetical protein
MDKKTIIIVIIAIAAVAGATIRLVGFNSGVSSRGNLKPFELLGTSAATAVTKLLNGNGSVVVVLETIDGMKNPNNEAQVKGFKAGLAKSKGVTLKEVKELKRDMSGDPRLWPEGQAGQIASLGDGAGAIVLFLNLPEALPPNDIAALKGSKAKILMVGTQSPLVNTLVTSGVIQVAIVARTPPPPPPSDTETPGQWFARVYTELKSP